MLLATAIIFLALKTNKATPLIAARAIVLLCGGRRSPGGLLDSAAADDRWFSLFPVPFLVPYDHQMENASLRVLALSPVLE